MYRVIPYRTLVGMEIPAQFAATTVESKGEAGRAWLAELPGIIEGCLERWKFAPDGPVLHGFMGVVLPGRFLDGGTAVLKVSWVDEETRWEPVALAAWNGEGAVRLLEHDDECGAMLLERLDPARSARELDGMAAATVLGRVCRRLAVAAPPLVPWVQDLAERWVEQIPATWRRLGRPIDASAVDLAVATCRELGPGQPRTLLHGDLVFDNVLRGEREPWLVIDPMGMAGEPAFDGGNFLGNRWSQLVESGDVGDAVRRRLAAFAEGAEVELERSRRWALVRLVNDALWCREYQTAVVPYVDTMIEALS